METVIVTRHPALVEVLRELGHVGKVITHATLEDVKGKVVVGVLPMYLAAQTVMFGEISLTLTAEQRGKELSVEEVKAAMTTIQWYIVNTEAQYDSVLEDAVMCGLQGSGVMKIREYVNHRFKHDALMASRKET